MLPFEILLIQTDTENNMPIC